ncbi:MAG: amidohydrolase [Thermoanaerobaculia bacterium]
MRTWILLAAAVIAGGCATVREPADLVLLGGRVFTNDPARPWAQGVAIRGETVAAVGPTRELRRYVGPGTRVVRLDGRLVVPGINDAHVHEPWGGDAAARLDVPNDATAATLLQAIRDAALARPLGTWIVATLPRSLIDAGFDRKTLDCVAPSHPVRLGTLGGHAALLNSKALREWRIDEKAEDGWLYEHAVWLPQRREAEGKTDEELRAEIEAFAAEAARFGITSVQTMSLVSPERVERLVAEVEPEIRWRVIEFRISGRVPPENEETRPIKYVLDGTPVERNAALRAPYADRKEWRGRLDYAPDDLREIIRRAATGERQLLVHASGDAAVQTVLDLMKSAGITDWPARRVRIEHGDGITDDLVDDVRALGAVVVQNPAHFMNPELIAARLGPERRRQWMKARSLLEAGIPFALGSDGPLNPWLNVMFATMHPTNPPEALTVEQGVRAYTRGSAFAEFEEHRKGTLAPGMLADLAVLSQDIFSVDVTELPKTTSEMTIVGGQVVWESLQNETEARDVTAPASRIQSGSPTPR